MGCSESATDRSEQWKCSSLGLRDIPGPKLANELSYAKSTYIYYNDWTLPKTTHFTYFWSVYHSHFLFTWNQVKYVAPGIFSFEKYKAIWKVDSTWIVEQQVEWKNTSNYFCKAVTTKTNCPQSEFWFSALSYFSWRFLLHVFVVCILSFS